MNDPLETLIQESADKDVRISELKQHLSTLRAENVALKGKCEAMKRGRDAAFAEATGFWRERDELAAAQAEMKSGLESLERERPFAGVNDAWACSLVGSLIEAADNPKAILDAHDKKLIQKYKDRMIHAGWPSAATALFTDGPAELSLCRMEVDQALAALVKPLVEALDSLCLSLNMHHGLEPGPETAKRIEKERGNATANHYLKARAALAPYKPCPTCKGSRMLRETRFTQYKTVQERTVPCPDCAGKKIGIPNAEKNA